MGSTPDSTRLPALDGLRALAIILVLLYHFHQQCTVSIPGLSFLFATGWTGVYLFFVLSGFLVGGLAFKEAQVQGSLSIPRFWSRRFFRTWPLYFVLLAFDFFYYGHISPSLIHFITFTQNFYPITFFIRSWSLAVEEQFYFFLPIVIWALLQRRRMKLLPLILGALFVLAHLFRLEHGFTKFTYHTLAVMDPLLIGIGIAYLRQFHSHVLEPLTSRPNRIFAAGLFVSLGLFWLPESNGLRQMEMPAALGIGYGLMLLAALNPTIVLRPVLAHPISRFIARISYSLYLTHGHFLAVLRLLADLWHFTGVWQTGFVVSGWWATSFLSAIVLYYGIERPALGLRDRYFPRSVSASDRLPTPSESLAFVPPLH